VTANGIVVDEGVNDMFLELLAKSNNILRMFRLFRIVTRIKKLRRLVLSLWNASQGVFWIFLLVTMVTYVWAEIGGMLFGIDITDEGDYLAGYYLDGDHELVYDPNSKGIPFGTGNERNVMQYQENITAAAVCQMPHVGQTGCVAVEPGTVQELFAYYGNLFKGMQVRLQLSGPCGVATASPP
jgi:hypothetical protein